MHGKAIDKPIIMSPPRWTLLPSKRILSMKRIVLVITEKCNMNCRYCFEAHRPSRREMSLDVAYRFIDQLFDQVLVAESEYNLYDFQFFGGEPLLRPQFIELVIDYIERKRSERGLDRFDYPLFTYRLVTNGTLFHNSEVQHLLATRKLNGIGLSLDGTRENHNRFRGSYDEIVEYLDLWKKSQEVPLALITLSPDTVECLYNNVVHVVQNLEIHSVYMNYVAEDGRWLDEEVVETFTAQLVKLADFLCLPENYGKVWLELFDLFKYTPVCLDKPACDNCRTQITCAPTGELYTCPRFASMQNRDQYSIGNIENWIDDKRLQQLSPTVSQIKNLEKCAGCSIGNGCKRCIAMYADQYGTVGCGDMNLCKIHHARYKATEYLVARRKAIWDSYFI